MNETLEDLKNTYYVQSFSFPKHFWKALGIEVLVIVALLLIFGPIVYALNYHAASFSATILPYKDILPQQGQPASEAFFGEPLEAVKNAFNKLVIGEIATLLASIMALMLILTLGQGIIWSTLLKKKFPYKTVWTKSLILLLWHIFWIIIFIAIALFVRDSIRTFVGIIEVLLFLYLNLFLYHAFATQQKAWTALKLTIKKGFGKFHQAILPCFMMAVTFWILAQTWAVANIVLPAALAIFIAILLFFIYLTWTKSYFIKLYKGALHG